MKTIFLFFFVFAAARVSAQIGEFDSLLILGKEEFKNAFEDQNFSLAVERLERAVKLRPDHPEARYFLGYAYSRLNAKDGKSMIDVSLFLTLKASEQLEMVNELEPNYRGEIIVLDPYTKLTSEWGSLAMSYWHQAKPDSAVWAFREGKKRGGFSPLALKTNKIVLDLCSKNSILISSGDFFTIPLWYVQIVEGYRKDVAVMDISLLNTVWFPAHLASRHIIPFDLSQAALDTLQYTPWTDSIITIGDFSWTVKPSYNGKYLLRGDRIFLSMLKENNFKRKIYFTNYFVENMRLSLGDRLIHHILVDLLDTGHTPKWEEKFYLSTLEKILSASTSANRNSLSEMQFVDNIRIEILNRVATALNTNDKKQAIKFMKLIDKYVSEEKYPYLRGDLSKYSDSVREKLKE